MIDLGESALAAIGMRTVLSKKVPRVTVTQVREMIGLGDEVKRRAALLCRGELGGKVRIAVVNYDQMHRQLVEEPDLSTAQEIAEKFPAEAHELAGRFLMVAGKAFRYLQTKFPVSTVPGLLGIDNLPPPSVSVTKFEMAFTVVDKPLALFDLLDANALLASQVECVQAVYPSLLQAICDAVTERVIYERGKVQSWAPHFGPALATLMGAPNMAPTTRAALDMANASRQPPGQAGRRPPQASSRARASATPARQLEAGNGVAGEDA